MSLRSLLTDLKDSAKKTFGGVDTAGSLSNKFWQSKAANNLAKYQQSKIGQSHIKAGKATSKVLFKNPYEFGQQTAKDISDLVGMNKPNYQMRNAPNTGWKNLKTQVVDRVLPTASFIAGTGNPAGVASMTALGGGINYASNRVFGKQDSKTALSNTIPQTIEMLPKSFQMAGISRFTNPVIEKAGLAGKGFVARNAIKAPLNVGEGLIMDKATGMETTKESMLIDALAPAVFDLGGMTFKSANDARIKAKYKIDETLGTGARKNGKYASLDQLLGKKKGKGGNSQLMGVMWGVQPYEDKDGKWRVRFNKERALLGLALSYGGTKVLKGADNTTKGSDLEEILKAQEVKGGDLISEARKYKSAEEFINAKFNEPPKYGMSHRPTFEGMPPAHNLLEGDVIPRDVYEHPEWSIAPMRLTDKPSKESFDALLKIRNNPDMEIPVYRASAKNELNNGDWITFSKTYAKDSVEGTEKVFTHKIKAKDAVFAGDDINEFGYYPKAQLTDIWNQANKVEGDIFSTKTEMGELDNLIDNSKFEGGGNYKTVKEYMEKYKGKTGEVVYMTPDEYLSKIPQSEKTQSSIDYMKKQIADGKKLPMPSLDYTGKELMQEGRNRAYLAKELGIEKIPVLVANKVGGVGVKNVEQKQELSQLKVPQEVTKIRGMENPRVLSPAENLPKIATGESPQRLSQVQSKESPYEPIIPQNSPEFSEFEASLRANKVSPKNKVGILDALRTPEKVMEKIGLGKEMKAIRSGWEKYLSDKDLELGKINKWYEQAPDKESSQAIFKYLDGQKVNLSDSQLKIANEIKTYLKDWADKLELPEDKRITSYITHIWDKDVQGVDIDPEFAKLIAEKVPGSVYDPFVEQRLGKQGYAEDVWRALDAYVKRATRKVNMDPALSKLKGSAEFLDLQSYNYVKKYADAINMRPTNVESLIDNTIKSVIGYRATARPTTYLTNKWRKTIFRGALGLNVGSSVRNLTQGVNTYAKLGEKYTILGYFDIAKRLGTKDGLEELHRVGVLDDGFVADRNLSALKRTTEKVDKVLFSLFDLAEKINRGSAYFGAKKKALAKGMDEESAIEFAKKIVRETQFTFGAIDTPQVLRSDVAKTLGQFQSFNLKQAEFLTEMIKAKDVAGLVRFTGGSLVMVATIGKLIGMDWKDNLPFADFITGDQKIANTPALQAITGAHQAIFGDEYEKSKGIDKLKKTAVLLAPAGSQIKKTIEGLKAGSQGYSSAKSGGARFLVPENRKLQTAVFGQYSTPEAREYFDNNRRPLSEKQTQVLKASTDKQATYQEIIQTREKNAIEDKVREGVRKSGEMQETEEKYIYWDSEKGETGSIKKNPDLSPPKLTGQSALDKETLSDYKSKLSSRINDIVKMYELGILTAEQAEAEIARLSAMKEIAAIKKSLSKVTSSSGSKKKKASNISQKILKTVKVQVKSPKFNTFEILNNYKKVKAPTIKAPDLKVIDFKTAKLKKGTK